MCAQEVLFKSHHSTRSNLSESPRAHKDALETKAHFAGWPLSGVLGVCVSLFLVRLHAYLRGKKMQRRQTNRLNIDTMLMQWHRPSGVGDYIDMFEWNTLNDAIVENGTRR